MSVCGRCGSIRAQAVKPTVVERVVAAVRKQRVVVCGRCGWRGRVPVQSPASDSTRRRRRGQRRHAQPEQPETAAPHAEIDFAALDKALDT